MEAIRGGVKTEQTYEGDVAPGIRNKRILEKEQEKERKKICIWRSEHALKR